MASNKRNESFFKHYHILTKGNNYMNLFKGDDEKNLYFKLLQKYSKVNEIKIIAHCILPNHCHLILKAELKNMSSFFNNVNSIFANHYNSKYKRKGSVFLGRYKSETIDSPIQLKSIIRYIHQDPVRTKIANCLSQYKWSSYKSFSNEDKLFYYNSANEFENFHKNDDCNIYLDIKKDRNKRILENLEKTLSQHLKKYKVISFHLLETHKKELIIDDILQHIPISHRGIANFLKVDINMVHRVSAK